MKKGDPIKMSWKELIGEDPLPYCPEGYSTVRQIAEIKKMSLRSVRDKLVRLRKQGKIDAVQGKNEQGYVTWFYKD